MVSPAALTPMLNSSLTEAVPSLAVTFTASVSTSAACGVPEKVRVVAVKPSHVGSVIAVGFRGRVGQRVAVSASWNVLSGN